jgi:signal transduction histidine kinase/ActR/RegA family two-component response regulator
MLLKSFGRRTFHRSTLLLVVVGLAASLGALFASREALGHSNDQLLREETTQGSIVLSSYLRQLTSPYVKLGSLVTPHGVSPTTFEAAAAKVSGTHSTRSAPTALLRAVDGRLSVIASVGHFHVDLAAAAEQSHLASLAATRDGNFAGSFVSSGQRWIEEIYGRGYVPTDYYIYSEVAVGRPGSVQNLTGDLYGDLDVAAYVGSVTPANLVLQTTKSVPSGNRQAMSVVEPLDYRSTNAMLTQDSRSFVAPGHLIVAMSAPINLSGRFVADYPWILLLIGLLATVTVALQFGAALTRRDEALRQVENMKGENAKLDEALSQQAHAEQNLRQAQRMEAVGQFAGGIAHDFNNLLQAIISYSEFLEQSIDTESEMQRDVAEIQKAAHRAATLTRQLLVFSRQDVPVRAVLDLNEIVRDAERFLLHTLGEDVSLECRTTTGNCWIVADAGELEMVLINLVINARDAMPRGGQLSITVDTILLDSFEASDAGMLPERVAKVTVQDNGSGMAPEVANRAFEPFYTTKEIGRGTGLGLAMVYGITKRCAGNASISTTLGKGTTITLLFPLTNEIPAESSVAPKRPLPSGAAYTVLVVEDQEGVRRSTARILEAAGYCVLQATDAVTAAKAYSSAPVDILVTDVIMPKGISGKDLADRLRGEQPDLPVVFISGYSALTIVERGILPPSTSLVMKPFSPQELLEAMSHAMSEKIRVYQ